MLDQPPFLSNLHQPCTWLWGVPFILPWLSCSRSLVPEAPASYNLICPVGVFGLPSETNVCLKVSYNPYWPAVFLRVRQMLSRWWVSGSIGNPWRISVSWSLQRALSCWRGFKTKLSTCCGSHCLHHLPLLLGKQPPSSPLVSFLTVHSPHSSQVNFLKR